MKDSYTSEELRKLGKYVPVLSGDIAVSTNTINCPGWLIFIPDGNEDKLIKTNYPVEAERKKAEMN